MGNCHTLLLTMFHHSYFIANFMPLWRLLWIMVICIAVAYRPVLYWSMGPVIIITIKEIL